jgi:hypothetical protein
MRTVEASAFISSGLAKALFRRGVSIGPGLTALTRMRRSLSSVAHLQAKRAHGSFSSRVNAESREPFDVDDGGVQDDSSAVGHQRKSLLHSECDRLNVKAKKRCRNALFNDGAEWNERTPSALAKRMSRHPFSLTICA